MTKDVVVDLPYGRSIFIAGLSKEDASEILADETRIESCDKNDAMRLTSAPEDTHALITMGSLLPQVSRRLAHKASERGLQVLGHDWRVEQLREWKTRLVINTIASVEDLAPDTVEEDVSLQVPRMNYLRTLQRQRPDLTSFRTILHERKKQGVGSILLVGVRRFDFPEKHRWVLSSQKVRVWSVKDITTLSKLSSSTRFVVYDPNELGELKCKVWERVLDKYSDIEEFSVVDASEMFEVTRNLIQCGTHPRPLAFVDSFETEPDHEDADGDDEPFEYHEDRSAEDREKLVVQRPEQTEFVQPEPEDTPEDTDLHRRYQAAVQERNDLQRQVQLLQAKAKGLEELIADINTQ